MASSENTRREQELLTVCIRHALRMISDERDNQQETIEHFRRLIASPGPDWPELIDLANRHRVTPLLYQGLSSALSSTINNLDSESTSNLKVQIGSLHRQQIGNAARNIRLTEKMLELIGIFTRENIVAIPFKGPLLAWELYGDPAMRQVTDLDFMVHPDDLHRAKHMLEAQGFSSPVQFTGYQERIWERNEGGYDMPSPGSEYTVDIRSNITPDYLPFKLSADEVFKEVREVTFEGKAIRTFSKEMLLLLLCYHGTKHLWHRLSWIADIGVLAQSKDIDVDKLTDLAERAGGTQVLRLGLEMAEIHLGLQLPGRMKDWKNNEIIPSELEGICALRLNKCMPEGTDWRIEYRFYLKMRKTLPARIRYVLKIFFRPTCSDCALIQLPESLSFLYYFIRPLRLVIKICGLKT